MIVEMVSGNIFSFKRFTVDQTGCAMKVGTDGVLLGAWCRINPREDKAILDIGTGTGLIALQLAQRTETAMTEPDAIIEAVEIDPTACNTARRNFEASEWSERLVAHPPTTVQEFARMTEATTGTAPRTFDHIVSNPPFFADSLASPDVSRNTARHTVSLSYDDLMKCCFRLLKPDGRVSLIVPAGVATREMMAVAISAGFLPSRLTEVHSTPKSGPKRTLVELSRAATLPVTPPETTTLIIGGDNPGTFSDDYRALTRDFYLYF